MRVCMILEGCYPYVYGGVSSWTHHYIQAMPDVEFVLWCIGADRSQEGQFKFTLPQNVVEVHEVFLSDALDLTGEVGKLRSLRLTSEEKREAVKLFSHGKLDFDILFNLFQVKKINPMTLLMSDELFNMLMDECREDCPYVSFTDYFYQVRSMLLPEMYLMTQEIPVADIYHCTATGYGGILGSMGKWKYHVPFIVTEHGIYTREREEELLRAKWVPPFLRQQWIDLFYRFSECAYSHADKITCLFKGAEKIQKDIGADPSKQSVIPNGVNFDNFKDIPPKKENGYIDIGAVVRIAKIKDIKTMIYAFAEVKTRVKNARLYILGDVDDEEYNKECHSLIQQLGIRDIIFTGVVDVRDYYPLFDFTILTSISEGQPLSILESLAAGRPVVATDVGCCRELIEGIDDDKLGKAGFIVPPMHKDQLADAIVQMCSNHERMLKMGEIGRQRAGKYYTQKMSIQKYRDLYKEVLGEQHGRHSV